MRNKMFPIILITAVIVFCGMSAAMVNPSFEDSVNDPYLDFNTPAGWERENYTAVVQNFIPEPEKGNTSNWQIDVSEGLSSFDGDTFVVLSNGDLTPDPFYAKLWQKVTFSPGQSLSGVYFFGTCDYTPFSDYATITLVAGPNTGLSDIEVVGIGASDVGDYGSTNGWVNFQSSIFTEATAGVYSVEIAVFDRQDNIFKSYIAVDALVPEPCTISLFGFGSLMLLRYGRKQAFHQR